MRRETLMRMLAWLTPGLVLTLLLGVPIPAVAQSATPAARLARRGER